LSSVSVSIPASHAGRDRRLLFLLPPPGSFQSPRPTRDATLKEVQFDYLCKVSIPASHAGRDFLRIFLVFNLCAVSIPASHAGRDRSMFVPLFLYSKFQSPRPTRDATFSTQQLREGYQGFNPRVPRGTRHQTHASVSKR